jgi:hypothetical protein
MGQQLYVLFEGELPSKAALTRCFKELGFPLAFERGSSALSHLTMRLRGEETRVNFFEVSVDRFKTEPGFERRFTRGVAFNWFADPLAIAIASCTATAIAKLTNGAIFHSDEDGAIPLERALAWARREVESTRQKVARPTTRQGDIRRYLKSLLKQRSDLALVGRFLFIRPVRHVLRYAHLAPTSDRYEFHVLRQCTPLFSRGGSTRHQVNYLEFAVWQPHFEPMLVDSLARDVFDQIWQDHDIVRSRRRATQWDFQVPATDQSHSGRRARPRDGDRRGDRTRGSDRASRKAPRQRALGAHV